MKILITGSSGQLSKALILKFQQEHVACIAPPEHELDITDAACMARMLDVICPDVLINAAAYNQVDQAEQDPTIAFKVNAESVATMAEETTKRKIRLVHYSSDYVFDGTTRRPYQEDDPTNPLNVYGQSKLAGENAIRELAPQSLILRLSWVFGDGPQNFFYKLDGWSRKQETLDVVWDQISTPTFTEDIAQWTWAAIKHGMQGTWHAVNSGYASRYETARTYLKLRHRNNIVIPVNSSKFPSPAQRPFFSVLANQAFADALGIEMPTWEDALARYCNAHPSQAI